MTLILLTVLCIRPPRSKQKPVGMSGKYPGRRYTYLYFKFFMAVGISSYNSMNIFSF